VPAFFNNVMQSRDIGVAAVAVHLPPAELAYVQLIACAVFSQACFCLFLCNGIIHLRLFLFLQTVSDSDLPFFLHDRLWSLEQWCNELWHPKE